MNNKYNDGSDAPVKYTIKVDSIADMHGYAVEIIDKFNAERYTLSGVYLERAVAIRDADAFVNDLFEKEISMFIN